jgi:N-acyl-phosphatidylethanolamine-hydrolysing phospholipase D
MHPPKRTVLAHHTPGGRFRNPWPDSEPPSWRAVLRWAVERRRVKRAANPPRGSFPSAASAIVYPRAGPADFFATWIGHSTVLLQIGALNVITDPVFSERASPVSWAGPRRVMDPAFPIESLPPLDVVLLSHNHYDHLDKSTIKRLARMHPDAAWVVPLALGATVRRWGAREIVELDWWQSADVHGLQVTGTPARHFSARGLGDRCQTLWCGYAIERAGRRAYFAGDTAYHPLFGEIGARCGPFDFVMLPIGAYDPRWFMHVVHADPEEAVQAYVDLIASALVPLPLMLAIHWGTFRLTDEPMDEPPRRAVAAWRQRGFDESRLWIAAFGETRRLEPPGGDLRDEHR